MIIDPFHHRRNIALLDKVIGTRSSGDNSYRVSWEVVEINAQQGHRSFRSKSGYTLTGY